jgi:hypothetical protein|tara:strand:+ start:1224 stop:1412 length:189 start_codon:yes stop_codon:yes gene_type:complete
MNFYKMKKMLTNIWGWIMAVLLIIDFFIIAFLFTVILVVLLSPFIILIGVPVLIEDLWKKKY